MTWDRSAKVNVRLWETACSQKPAFRKKPIAELQLAAKREKKKLALVNGGRSHGIVEALEHLVVLGLPLLGGKPKRMDALHQNFRCLRVRAEDVHDFGYEFTKRHGS